MHPNLIPLHLTICIDWDRSFSMWLLHFCLCHPSAERKSRAPRREITELKHGHIWAVDGSRSGSSCKLGALWLHPNALQSSYVSNYNVFDDKSIYTSQKSRRFDYWLPSVSQKAHDQYWHPYPPKYKVQLQVLKLTTMPVSPCFSHLHVILLIFYDWNGHVPGSCTGPIAYSYAYIESALTNLYHPYAWC